MADPWMTLARMVTKVDVNPANLVQCECSSEFIMSLAETACELRKVSFVNWLNVFAKFIVTGRTAEHRVSGALAERNGQKIG